MAIMDMAVMDMDMVMVPDILKRKKKPRDFSEDILAGLIQKNGREINVKELKSDAHTDYRRCRLYWV